MSRFHIEISCDDVQEGNIPSSATFHNYVSAERGEDETMLWELEVINFVSVRAEARAGQRISESKGWNDTQSNITRLDRAGTSTTAWTTVSAHKFTESLGRIPARSHSSDWWWGVFRARKRAIEKDHIYGHGDRVCLVTFVVGKSIRVWWHGNHKMKSSFNVGWIDTVGAPYGVFVE